MKTNKKTIQSAMDARLAFLDERPSCRAAVQYRIAQEEEPVMKKKLSLGLVLAMVLVLLTAAALAATLLLSPRAIRRWKKNTALRRRCRPSSAGRKRPCRMAAWK